MRNPREPTRASNEPSRSRGPRAGAGAGTDRPPRPIQRGAAPPAPGSAARGSWTTPKRLIWTGAFAAVTIVGSIYGVGLKTQQEYHSVSSNIYHHPHPHPPFIEAPMPLPRFPLFLHHVKSHKRDKPKPKPETYPLAKRRRSRSSRAPPKSASSPSRPAAPTS